MCEQGTKGFFVVQYIVLCIAQWCQLVNSCSKYPAATIITLGISTLFAFWNSNDKPIVNAAAVVHADKLFADCKRVIQVGQGQVVRWYGCQAVL